MERVLEELGQRPAGTDIPLSIEDHQILDEVRAALFGATPRPKVGRYEVGAPLGRGGGGVVYRARDPSLDRELAVKFVRREAAGPGSNSTARIQREARALARLAHPHVVSVFDVGDYDIERDGLGALAREIPPRGLFVAMELVEGVTLRRWLESPREVAEIVDMFVQCARGLAAAHAAGLVHRDFKTSNVLVTPDGIAKVLDFGLATPDPERIPAKTPAHQHRGPADLTATGDVLGTPWTMAPEQLEGRACEPRTDQYSLSFCLHEALFGTLDAGDLEELHAIKRGGKLPRTAARSIPRRIAAVIARGTRPEPNERFDTLEAWIDAVERRGNVRRGVWTGVVGLAALGLLAMLPRGADGNLANERASAPQTEAPGATVAEAAVPARLRGAYADLERGSYEVAERDCREALDENPTPLLTAAAWVCLGEVAGFDGRSGDALEFVEPAYWLATEAHDPYLAARAAAAAALFHRRLTNGSGAQLWTRHALAALERSDADPLALRGEVRIVEASSLVSQGDVAAALPEYERAYQESLAELGPDHRRTIRADLLVGNALQNNGRAQEALQRHDRALASYRRVHAAPHLDIARALNDRATSLTGLEREDEARAMVEEALAMMEGAGKADHPLAGMILHNLGYRFVLAGQPEASLEHYRRSIAIREATKGPRSLKVLKSMTNLANSLVSLQRYDEAEDILLDAITRYEERGVHPQMRRPLRTLIRVYQKTANEAGQARIEQRLREHEATFPSKDKR